MTAPFPCESFATAHLPEGDGVDLRTKVIAWCARCMHACSASGSTFLFIVGFYIAEHYLTALRFLTLLRWVISPRRRREVSFRDIWRYLATSPRRNSFRYIASLWRSGENLRVSFRQMQTDLFWPTRYAPKCLYIIVPEICDPSHWHNYEHPVTPVRRDDVVVDIGAGEGLFSLSVVDRCRRVIAVEPNRHFCASLRATFDAPAHREKVTVHHVAVGDREGYVRLLDRGLLSTVVPSRYPDIPLYTLDELLRDEPNIDYVKVDIEGWEQRMLLGARQIIARHRPRIAITCHHAGNDWHAMAALIKEVVPAYTMVTKGFSLSGKPVMLHCSV